MSPTVNLDEAGEWGGGGPVPDGKYAVVVDDAYEKQSAAGNDMIELTLKIATGDCAGRNAWDRLVFTPKALGRVRYVLDALGVTIPQGAFNLSAESLRGKRALVTLKTKHKPASGDYEARDVQEVVGWEKAGGESNPALAAAMSTFAGKLDDDDDLPFG